MNWGEIYNTARRALFNAGEIVRKSWALHFDPTPRDVRVSFYDETGNLTNVTIPNRAKMKEIIWSDAKSAMMKVFYLRDDGDDNNEGSRNAPLRTIKEAVERTPVGGVVYIYLLSDHTEPANGKIPLLDRFVRIDGYRDDGQNNYRRKCNFTIAPRGSYNTVHGFSGGGQVTFRFCDVSFVDNSDPNLPYDSFSQIHSYNAYGLFGSMYADRSKFTIPDKAALNLIKASGAGIGTYMFNCYKSEIVAEGSNSFAFLITNSTLLLNLYDLTVSGAKSSVADLIAGLVKDSNNNPRNVVSNIIL